MFGITHMANFAKHVAQANVLPHINQANSFGNVLLPTAAYNNVASFFR
jgi:hypothetical protein